MRFPRLQWLLCSALLVSVAVRASAQSRAIDSGGLFLKPGDVLRLTVWQRPELSGDFPIGGDGTIAHPIYHALHVAGVPLAEVEGDVHEFLKSYVVEPQVAVQPLLHVGVSGEVHLPSVVLVPPNTSLSQVVAMTGGPTDRGAMNRVRLIRDNRQIVIDLSGSARPGAPLDVRSGDQVWVDRQTTLLRDHIAPLASVAAAIAAAAYYGFKRH
jgi:protein involved in polysaccharide export with SLBB domain